MRFHVLHVAVISVLFLVACEESESSEEGAAEAVEEAAEKASPAKGDDKPGSVLGNKIVEDYKTFLGKAKKTVQSNRSLDEMYTQIVALRAHYTQVMVVHAKARIDLGKDHTRDVDKIVNRQREVLPINLTNWIQTMAGKYASLHPRLAESLVDLAVFINYYNLDELEKSDPDRAAKLKKMLAEL